jgi:hypothetical protein
VGLLLQPVATDVGRHDHLEPEFSSSHVALTFTTALYRSGRTRVHATLVASTARPDRLNSHGLLETASTPSHSLESRGRGPVVRGSMVVTGAWRRARSSCQLDGFQAF